jgi:hypothetical protein
LHALVLLLEKGASPNCTLQPNTGMTATQRAASEGDVEILEYLIAAGGDIHQPAARYEGRTTLQAACEGHHIAMVRFLLHQKVDINAPAAKHDGCTALEASLDGKAAADIFNLLMQEGACMADTKHAGRILRRLISGGLFDKIHLAISAGADVNEMTSSWDEDNGVTQRTCLQAAAEKGDTSLVTLLLSNGGDINAKAYRDRGKTALQAATSRKQVDLDLVRFLLDRGANINAPAAAERGATALQGAAIRGHINVVLLLLENGADPNGRPALLHGRTALEGAAEHGRLDVVKMLLNAGAGPRRWGAETFDQEIQIAEENGHFTVANLIRKHQELHGGSGRMETLPRNAQLSSQGSR